MQTNLAYNGKDYYDVFSAYNFYTSPENAAAMESPYVKAIYNGPFREKTETTKAYAEYAYYSTCLLLDLTFGHKQEKNITTFDEYFTRMNAKAAMCSTKPSVAVTADYMLFNYLFDSGHDAFFSTESVFGQIERPSQEEVDGIVDEIKESEEGKEMFENAESAVRSDEELTADVILGALMEKGLKIPELAPLLVWTMFFDSNRPENYGSQRLDYAGDTAVIFFDSFKDDSTIRSPSYYLDAATGLVSILGFLSPDGEVRITDLDMLAGSFIDAYGRCGYYSGMLKLGTDDGTGFVSNEKATTLDLNMAPSILDIKSVPWYDPEGIADAVHQYQNGATEISHEAEREAELAEALRQLFEGLE